MAGRYISIVLVVLAISGGLHAQSEGVQVLTAPAGSTVILPAPQAPSINLTNNNNVYNDLSGLSATSAQDAVEVDAVEVDAVEVDVVVPETRQTVVETPTTSQVVVDATNTVQEVVVATTAAPAATLSWRWGLMPLGNLLGFNMMPGMMMLG